MKSSWTHSDVLDNLEVPNEVTDALNEPVRSTSNQSFGFHRTDCAGLRGACGRIPGSFAFLLCHFLNITIRQLKRISMLRLSPKVSLKYMHKCRKYQPFAESTTSGKKYLKITWAQEDNTGITAWGEMCLKYLHLQH